MQELCLLCCSLGDDGCAGGIGLERGLRRCTLRTLQLLSQAGGAPLGISFLGLHQYHLRIDAIAISSTDSSQGTQEPVARTNQSSVTQVRVTSRVENT